MRAPLAALHNLRLLASSDGEVCALEKRVLNRYRRMLRVRTRELQRLEGHGLITAPSILDSPRECAHVVRMMGRVAYSDGSVGKDEEKFLNAVADSLGIGDLEFAEIMVSAGADSVHRALVRRRLWIGGAACVVAAVCVTAVIFPFSDAGASKRIELLEARLDQMPSEDAARISRSVRQSWVGFEDREKDLARRLDSLEKSSVRAAEASESKAAEVAGKLADLRQKFSALRGARTVSFKKIERDYRGSVLLVIAQFYMTRAKQRVRESSSGTGFFVSPDGLIATNKHVLQPWKFVPRIVARLNDGYRVDHSSMRIMAWPGGAQILTEKSRLNVKAGFDSASRTLKLLAVSPDTMSSTTRTTKKGARVRGTFHASDNTDLAVLKAEVPSPVRCFDLLLRPEGVEALDPVMVMGFPTGTRILEDRRANHSPSVGVVRKVEDTIFIDAAIVGGNSGGPVVNTGGQVIGMATRVFGSASLGSCIRPKYLQALFPGASYFLARAKAFAKAHPDAARQSLRLVEALGPTAGQSREVQAIKASLQR